MARSKPLSAAYAKRIASAQRRGKTLQEARGKKAGEHIVRADKERVKIAEELGVAFGLSTSEIERIRGWATRRLHTIKDGTWECGDPEEILAEAFENGWPWFVNYRETWNAERLRYVQEVRSGEYGEGRGMGHLRSLAKNVGVSDLSWVYYH